MRWNDRDAWIWSAHATHEELVTPEDFARVQTTLAAQGRTRETKERGHTRNRYVLRGVIHCGICDRRVQGRWSNRMPYYRCRYPQEYALANRVHHPRNVLLRENQIVPALVRWFALAFSPDWLKETIDRLHARQDSADSPDRTAARAMIEDCTRKVAGYRATIDAGASPALVGRWIAETEAKLVGAQARFRAATGRRAMIRDEIATLIAALGDMTSVLHHADLADKAEVYKRLRLKLIYRPAQPSVRVEANPDPHAMGLWSVSEVGVDHYADALDQREWLVSALRE